jgi:hypothetical protein
MKTPYSRKAALIFSQRILKLAARCRGSYDATVIVINSDKLF